ncbi:multicopper oxidase domain-containing protein [Paludisphaera mucosa]|uniref:Multicopper oxidase domain-containing protein n=1 Tax=Paludisphaera mucosa TaxID=3030827 RepID=A0ABT6FJV3_9BACT|nr:multicopper oxidase domain-containing protein [Paludisphaera mucosa]MDG3007781.1 multicopper oxidase domain-containing protein [Paludisphaera mucosa]
MSTSPRRRSLWLIPLVLPIVCGPARAQDDKSRTAREASAQKIQEAIPPAAQQFRRDLRSFIRSVDEKERFQAAPSAAAAAAELERARYRNPYFRSGEERRSSDGVLDTSLSIVYGERKLWRPDTLKTDGRGGLLNAAGQPLPEGEEPVVLVDQGVIGVRLRSYEGLAVGPTLRVKPGEILRVKMKNQLPPENPDDHQPDVNVPHGFNRTNLHTHGLHVTPVGNGDNVLLTINPGEEFINEIPVPEDHVAGTFWYHAHLHGSTAMQVSSGMAGALIIDAPEDHAGAVDNVPGIATAEERICLFQQIAYHPEAQSAPGLKLLPMLTEVGGLPQSGQDEIVVGRVGATLHFRIFDAKGVRTVDTDETKLIGKESELTRFRERLEAMDWPPSPTPEQRVELVAAVRSLAGLVTYVLEDFNRAFGPRRWIDGKKSQGWRTTVNGQLQPVIRVASGKLQRFRFIHGGIRDPIVVQFAPIPEDLLQAGRADEIRYDVDAINDEGMREFALDGIPLPEIRRTKAIELQPGYRSEALVRLTNTTGRVQHYLMWDGPSTVSLDPAAQDSTKEAGILAIVEVLPGEPGDEEAWPTLHDFSKVRRPIPIAPQDVVGLQTINLELNPAPAHPSVNGRSYDPDAAPLAVKLGRTDEWRLTTNAAAHPFHIHVNPFYVVSETSQDGVVTPIGVWKDTLLVTAGRTQTIRTHYKRYIGDFVLHCHILDHEDQGMMMGVSIKNTTYEVGAKLANPHPAPRWSLPDAADAARKLDDLLGSDATVLVFLQRQDCPACNAQIRAFRDAVSKFPDLKKVDVVFVAPGEKAAFQPDPAFPYTAVYDKDLGQFKAYGCYVPRHKAALHGMFLLDKTGQVRWREVSDAPYMNIDQLLREVDAIKR